MCRYRQNELKEGAQRSVGKQYYYIDYEHFCNVVKWRIAKMRHIIDSTLRNVRSFTIYLLFRLNMMVHYRNLTTKATYALSAKSPFLPSKSTN